VARVLIVGCGARGQALAADLQAAGHRVRGTTRDPARAQALADAGIEPHVGDPDRIGTLLRALEHVTVVVWLMGSAHGDRESLSALHGTRLAMMLERSVDTTVRGFVYEARGSVPDDLLAAGAATVREANGTWEVPVALLRADPADHDAWRRDARTAVEALLAI
jgi:uncharacterized protein YbjT (DUF2867 family)